MPPLSSQSLLHMRCDVGLKLCRATTVPTFTFALWQRVDEYVNRSQPCDDRTMLTGQEDAAANGNACYNCKKRTPQTESAGTEADMWVLYLLVGKSIPKTPKSLFWLIQWTYSCSYDCHFIQKNILIHVRILTHYFEYIQFMYAVIQ